MTAGTIGGNISYSNGTTQTINAVKVPTAPGVTSAIEALQTRMTAVEQKNTTQDSQISAIDARVKAIEDTPGVGQFAAGKLGTIAGSAADGRVAAEDDGTGSVNGWSALKTRVTTAEGQIATAQNDISALDGTVAQQTADISGLMNSKQDKSLTFSNVTPVWAADTTYSDYGFKGTITLSGVTSSMFAEVVFSVVDATSGNYAPICETFNGGIYIYGKVSDAVTIPQIIITVI